ncbi:MAG: DNA ligase D [Alphaproteobacteria bacterium]|nr:DNA ligase D [Alphaproteobacteria bacterium]
MAPRKLAGYRAKRDFSKTAEPPGIPKTSGKKLIYMIQKHAASRLHYDFRLEWEGVLLSWAVTKGPSLDPAERRLAVHVEDHPVAYATFEGTIPKGQYGGGTVMLWDRGSWEPLEDMQKSYKKGHMRFLLHGERLKGEWHLVRMAPRGNEKGKDNWLLIKSNDEEAKPGKGDHAVTQYLTSIASGRSMEEITGDRKSKVWQSNREEKKKVEAPPGKKAAAKTKVTPGRDKLPAFVEPQLATLVAEPPNAPGWVHEIKFDGYRALARLDGEKVQILTRSGKDWTAKFRSVAEAVAQLDAQKALLDGEIVALNDEGASSFAALQKALSENDQGALHYYLFDLLHLNGHDLMKEPLATRKEQLRALTPEAHPLLHYSEHFTQEGEVVLHKACAIALEGIVSKRLDARYRSGRGDSWLKSKCIRAQEFVIGGFTDQTKHAGVLGALLIGYYEQEKLILCGKVGTGFTTAQAADLRKKLHALKRAEPPFDVLPRGYRKGAIWVEPTLVAQVEFTEWTKDNVLRHPSFQGLREDKPATEVVREKAQTPPASRAAERQRRSAAEKASPDPRAQTKREADSAYAGVTISNPQKVLYPEDGITKRDLAEYYTHVAERMLPHIVGRPISLVRCPEGYKKPCFFQRHTGDSTPKSVRTIMVERKGERHPYLTIDDATGLLSLVQMGALEIHCWGSRGDKVLQPDRIVFDFDPAEDVAWQRVKEAATEARGLLDRLGLESFLKSTGGKGLHVVVPILRGPGWDEVKTFAKTLSEFMAQQAPERYTLNMRKVERKGRIFIDYLRNDLTASAVAPYSTRARAGAPVSVPLAWNELPGLKSNAEFTIATVPARLKRQKKDPWANIDKVRQKLPKL